MSNSPLYLFQDMRPDLIKLENLYNPDIHASISSPEDAEQLGLIVPSLRSIIIGPGPKYTKYDVIAVDPDTFKSTLQQWTIDLNYADETYFINYGNDIFCLYYDDRVKPIQLLVDGKLLVFGESNTEYRIRRVNPSTKVNEIISVYLDSDGKFVSDRIPLRSVTHPMPSGWKICTNCHTLLAPNELIDGDTVTLEIYNNLGELTTEFRLIVRRAIPLNDLDPESNPIIGFDATALQMQGDTFVLYEKQDETHLGIQPFLTFANGHVEQLTIDNENCFLYGFDDFIPSFSGLKRKILIKYFLSKRMQSSIAISDRKTRYVSVTKDLIVIPNESTLGLKISIVPLWNPVDGEWVLHFYAYTERQDQVYDITSLVTIEHPFDGSLFGVWQQIQYSVKLQSIFGLATNDVYRQNTWICVFHNSMHPKYLFKDSPDADKVYGIDVNESRRPVLHYDASLQQYFVPTSIFLNESAFLNSFYYLANPPFNYQQNTQPIVPDYFTIRDLTSMNTVIAIPIEVTQYYQAWNIIPSTNPPRLVNSTVLVEFLKKVGDEYKIIYGVPVEVVSGTYTYQGPNP
jgi:hypothetical protein